MDRALVALAGIGKRFGRAVVLDDVSFALAAGEVVALLGANGAGKSTLVKVLSGVHAPDSGTVLVEGRRADLSSPVAARRAGIFTVHQIIDDGVVQDLTVTENLLLDELCAPGSPAFVGRRAMRARAAEIAAGLGLDLPLDRPVREIGQADRQLVAIARALAHAPRLLILDEPTSSLSEAEAERLFEVVRRLRDQGVAILYISHRMNDIRRLADRAIVLRDGRLAGRFEAPLDLPAAIAAMLGRNLAAADGRRAATAGEAVVRFEAARIDAGSAPFDLTLHAGEVVVLTGLLGAGKSEIAESLYGLRRLAGGSLTLDGRPWAPASPGAAIAGGVHLAAEDRATSSLVRDFSVERNVTLPFLRGLSVLGLVDRRRERALVGQQIRTLAIKTPAADAPIGALSGGNQQKVVLARWLCEPCRVLVFDEPFQGVDIAARADIGRRLRETSAGRATLLVCADVEEAFEVADRIVVVRDRTIVADNRVEATSRDDVIGLIAAAEHEAAGAPARVGASGVHEEGVGG